MGLTRPRAHQLQDIDYKQTARAITVADVTLSGGAPAVVDGVSLALRDRVLVTAQSTGSENGIYYVTTVGAGSNGTWARSLDADATGEIKAGTIIMITEGTAYADTQWKLTTDDPITVGTTTMTFVRNGNAAFGIVAVSGEDNLVADQIGDTLTLVAGTNIAITTVAGTDTLTITPSLTPAVTSLTATGNVTSANVTVNDVLRIAQTGSGLRMTNVGGFDNNGSDNFRVFGTNDLILAANGDSGTAITIDTTNQDVAITNDLRVDNGNLYIGGVAVSSTATELNYLDGTTLTANEIAIADGTGAFITTSNLISIDTSNNRVGINTSSPRSLLDISSSVSGETRLFFTQSDNSTDAPNLRIEKSRGSVGSEAAVQNGDGLYRQNTFAHDGTSYLNVGQLEYEVNGTVSTGTVPTRFAISTRNNSTDTMTQRIQVTGDTGVITFNDEYSFPTADGSANQVLSTDGSGTLTFGDVVAPAGTLSGSTLASGVTGSSLTSVGTLGSLAVTGNITSGNGSITGTLSIDNTTTDDSLLITTTEDSSSAGPVISLKRNSASPADADYLGQLKFKGENDADQEVVYAKITGKIQDASDGSEDGLIEFTNSKAGSNNINMRLRSDSLQLLNGTNLQIREQQDARFYDSDSSNYIGFKAPSSVASDVDYILPADGSNGQVLSTNGSGTLSFVDNSGGGSGSSFPNCTVTPLPGSEGNFDLAKQYDQTGSVETPFEAGGTDAFGVNLGEIYTMMDPVGSIPTATDLGVLS